MELEPFGGCGATVDGVALADVPAVAPLEAA